MEPTNNKSNTLLNTHTVLPVSYANGPGGRAVVWTQGCSMRCPGCSNLQTHSHKPRILINPKKLADFILSIPKIEGLTVTGGEPFEQAQAVFLLCQAVRKAGLSVMVFTGWNYEYIISENDKAVQNLLNQIDILVDGPFIQKLADKNLIWRGSSNQKVRFLTSRYNPEVLKEKNISQTEAQLFADSPLQVTGFPEKTDLEVLAAKLHTDSGILLEPAGEA